MTGLRSLPSSLLAVAAALAVPAAMAQTPTTAPPAPAPHAHDGHMVRLPTDIKWADIPSLPPGAKLAVLEGSMAEAAPFTARLRLPANFRIPAHWHPAIERITVLSGTFYMGTGEIIDTSKGIAVPTGGFTTMPPRSPHFAYTSAEPTEIQLNSTGPWSITYINPADDPRRKP